MSEIQHSAGMTGDDQAPAPVSTVRPLTARRRRVMTTAGILLMVPGLGMSAWSMYSYIRTTTSTAPVWIAISASTAFDGLALFSALMAHEAVQRGGRSWLAWGWLYLSVAASTIINWGHASLQHWPFGIHLMLSAPALLAAGGFEMILQLTRREERAKREKRRRTRQPAKVDLDLYLRHPLKVWRGRQAEAVVRLAEVFPDTVSARRISVVSLAPAPALPDNSVPALPAGEDIASGDIRPELSAPPAAADIEDTDNGQDADKLADLGQDILRDIPRDIADSLVTLPAQDDGRGRRGRTSVRDTADIPADLGSLIPAELLNAASAANPPKVAEVVRLAYRDEWDTGTIRAVVAHVLPDAKPDTINKAIGRHRTARGQTDTTSAPSAGQYL